MHPEAAIKYVEAYCELCGAYMELSNKQLKKRVCTPCGKKYQSMGKRLPDKEFLDEDLHPSEVGKEPAKKPMDVLPADCDILVARSNCEYRYDCLNHEAHKQRSKGLACKDCNKYKPKEY